MAILISSAASARVLPGFEIRPLGVTSGFTTSLAVDSKGTVYYTTQSGDIFRFAPAAGAAAWQSTFVTHVPSGGSGDSGLLGMALRDDVTAVVHYTTPNQTADVISLVDLATGRESLVYSFVCDVDVPSRGTTDEHHGGNPIVAADGTIFVGIGDYNNGSLAPDPRWNAGKIFRIRPNGVAEIFASGFRNPFDMWWDAAHQRLIAPDNGNTVDDEINIVTEGGFYGWPFTMGNAPPVAGAVLPVYTFPTVIAPTGLAALGGRNRILRRGLLLGGFVTSAIYYIPDIDAQPFPDPVAIIEGEPGFIVDVVEGPDGTIYFANGTRIYELAVPLRGDCDGDGLVTLGDVVFLAVIIAGGAHPVTAERRGTWGCDVNGDGIIDAADVSALIAQLGLRTRAVRVGTNRTGTGSRP